MYRVGELLRDRKSATGISRKRIEGGSIPAIPGPSSPIVKQAVAFRIRRLGNVVRRRAVPGVRQREIHRAYQLKGACQRDVLPWHARAARPLRRQIVLLLRKRERTVGIVV